MVRTTRRLIRIGVALCTAAVNQQAVDAWLK